MALSNILAAWEPREPVPLPSAAGSGEIEESLEALGVLGRVLYVAAHPDDENTRLIAEWARGRLYEVAYLSLTRGGGGQNLIGPELGDALGVIRTQELLAARAIDGGRQFFSRAKDFGFSKNAQETLAIWDRDVVLSDIVWVIRKYRPDIIVTRFRPEESSTHGHHTASALLTVEAFSAAADPLRFPEQLEWVEPWQARRVIWNTSQWFFRNQDFNPEGWMTEESGDYLPRLGQSPGEIAARSRSQHKSQGFGAQGSLGRQTEYFAHLAGSPAETDPFEGIATDWRRNPAATRLTELLAEARESFLSARPWETVPTLLEVRNELEKLDDAQWADAKLAATDGLIAQMLGLDFRAVASQPSVVPGDSWTLKIEAINRSPIEVEWVDVAFPVSGTIEGLGETLEGNQLAMREFSVTLPASAAFSQPYWLEAAGTIGMYGVADQRLLEFADNAPAYPVQMRVKVGGTLLAYTVPAIERRVDPVRGEMRTPLVITPPVYANFVSKVLLFADSRTKDVWLDVGAAAPNQDVTVTLELPAGWSATPESIRLELERTDEEQRVRFSVTAPEGASDGTLAAVLKTSRGVFRHGRQRIQYEHIPSQTLFPPATARVVRLDLARAGSRIGYLPGAGDGVADALREVGYAVDLLNPASISAEELSGYDAVVLGIRAYNTIDAIANLQPMLFRYVEEGGTLIVQYNTNSRLKVDAIAPIPLQISRARVTDENAPVTFLAPEHRVLNFPNRITPSDFEGWVQERGLYFADRWDDAFVPVIASHDPGEAPLAGGLLVAQYGEGHFVYTGYSWFRQLPAGVPGAFRLFVNMLSLGADE